MPRGFITLKTTVSAGMLALVLAGCGKKETPAPAPVDPAPKSGAAIESVLTPADQTPPPPPPTPDSGANVQPAATPPGVVVMEEPIHPLSDRDVAMLNYAVGQFRQSVGRNPKSLQEMVNAKFLPRIPQTHPSERLVYDPNTGRMKVEKIK
jgi:hypothetical protein